MSKTLSFNDFNDLKKENKRIIVSKQIDSNSYTPENIYQTLKEPDSLSSLFEHVGEDHTHFSYLAFHPKALFKSKNGVTQISNKEDNDSDDPYMLLRQFIKDFAPSSSSQHPSFSDSLFGFIAYDAIRLVEKLPDQCLDSDNIPDLYFVLFETILIFNHNKKSLVISVSVDPSEDYETALQKINTIEKKIQEKAYEGKILAEKYADLPIEVDLNDDEYKEAIVKAKEFITRGEIFQIVISRVFTLPVKSSPFQIFCALKQVNLSPYMFLFETDNFSIVGASPEKLVSVMNGTVETVPVGGTYPKEPHKTAQQTAEELLADPKEVAEHNMKMEVGRNDIGAVSVPGSVKILELRGTRAFSHVVHIVTRIEGKLRKELDCFDAVIAILPAATLSGSPKLKALEIIDQLEKSRRGIYGGAVCMVDSKGNLNSCITIRTIVIFPKKGIALIRAGAGAVAYSDPAYEAGETRHKAKAAMNALKLAEGNLT